MKLSFKRIFIIALCLCLFSITVLVTAGETEFRLKNSNKLKHPAYGVALDPTGQLLAVGSCAARVNREANSGRRCKKGLINIYDIESGEEAGRLQGGDGAALELSYQSRGKLLAGRYSDGSVMVWNYEKGSLYRKIKSKEAKFTSLDISPDGNLLAIGTASGQVEVWDIHKAKIINQFSAHSDRIGSISFGPDGDFLATGSFKRVKVWDGKDRDLLETLNQFEGEVFSLSFTLDGEYLAGSSYEKILIWEADDWTTFKTLSGHRHWITSVDFTPNGEYLASGSLDRSVRLWDIDTGRPVETLTGHAQRVYSVDVGPGGDVLVSASEDQTFKTWDLKRGNEPPVAEFEIKPDSPRINQKIKFDSAPSFDPDGAISSYTWIFPDRKKHGPVVFHQFSRPGKVSVKLRVTDKAGETSTAALDFQVRGEKSTKAETNHPQTGKVTALIGAEEKKGPVVGSKLLVSLGTEQGVKVGDRVVIYERYGGKSVSVEPIKEERGRAKITDTIGEERAIAEITSLVLEVEVGNYVELLP